MKKLPLYFLSASLALVLAACGGGTAPPDTSGNPIVTPAPVATTATLTLNVVGVAAAPVKVVDSTGTVKFEGSVSGSKNLPDLTRGNYTVTAGAVTDFAVPAVQTADLSGGNGAVTLTYVALAGRAVNPSTISGKVPDWKFGFAKASLAHVNIQNGQLISAGGLVSPAGTIAADGTLAIALPDSQSLESGYTLPVLPPESLTSCVYSGEAINRNVSTEWFSRTLVQVGVDPLGSVQEYVASGTEKHIVARIYSEADALFKGTLTCQATSDSDAYSEVYDLQLVKGWNIVETYLGTDGAYRYISLPAGARVSLLFKPFQPSLQVALSDPYTTIQFKPGDRVTRNVTLVQTGGFSGTVALSTTIPGVTVEPATLTLKPIVAAGLSKPSDLRALRRQDLGAQSVKTELTFVVSADAADHEYSASDQLQIKDASGTLLRGVPFAATVTTPSVFANLNYGGGVSLDRGQTVSVPVNLYSINGYNGPVSVKLENLADGVSATTLETIYGASTPGALTITASAGAVTGTRDAQLVINAGGKITRGPIGITVNKPGVQVSLGQYNSFSSELTLRRGESRNLSIQVKGTHGFTGATTLSLKGLPNGVSATPLTVQVIPGAVTNASVTLTASVTADLGATTLDVIGDDLEPSYGNAPQVSLTVNVAITATLTENVSIARAATGIWTLSRNSQYGGGSGYIRTLTHVENGQTTLNKTIMLSDFNPSLIASPSGNAVIAGSSMAMVIQADGSTNTFNIQGSNSTFRPVVDSQNQLWFVAYDSAVNRYSLSKLNLDTGVQTNILDAGNSYSGVNNVGLYRNDTGTMLYIANLVSSSLLQVDPGTGQKVKEIALPGISGVQALAIAQNGTIWGGQYYGGTFRINADGTLTIFTTLPGLTRMTFDASDPDTLWGSHDFSKQVSKINVATGTAISIPTGTVSDIAADSLGGLWVEMDDSTYSTANYSLSLVR